MAFLGDTFRHAPFLDTFGHARHVTVGDSINVPTPNKHTRLEKITYSPYLPNSIEIQGKKYIPVMARVRTRTELSGGT